MGPPETGDLRTLTPYHCLRVGRISCKWALALWESGQCKVCPRLGGWLVDKAQKPELVPSKPHEIRCAKNTSVIPAFRQRNGRQLQENPLSSGSTGLACTAANNKRETLPQTAEGILHPTFPPQLPSTPTSRKLHESYYQPSDTAH